MASEIKVDTISEKTSANGVAIDSVILKDGKIDVQGVDGGIIVDADNDTTISANTDDELLIKTAGNTGLKIDANGIITKPLQPAFFATMGGSDVNVDSGDHTVQFSVERFDLNADYNTGTYTFTAPVTGKYFVSSSICHQDIGTEYVRYVIKSSNREYPILHGNSETFNTGQYHGLIDMDASDTVYIMVNSESDTNWNIRANEGHFSVHLVA